MHERSTAPAVTPAAEAIPTAGNTVPGTLGTEVPAAGIRIPNRLGTSAPLPGRTGHVQTD